MGHLICRAAEQHQVDIRQRASVDNARAGTVRHLAFSDAADAFREIPQIEIYLPELVADSRVFEIADDNSSIIARVIILVLHRAKDAWSEPPT